METHDLHFLKTAKVHFQSPFSASLLLKLRAELGSYAAVRALFAISPNETTFFRMLLPDTATYFISSWTSPTAARPSTPCRGGLRLRLRRLGVSDERTRPLRALRHRRILVVALPGGCLRQGL